MARLAVLAILFLVAAGTITSTHGGRTLKAAGSGSRVNVPIVLEVAEPPSSLVEDIAALLRLLPRTAGAAAADGPVASYYQRTDYDYKVPITGF